MYLQITHSEIVCFLACAIAVWPKGQLSRKPAAPVLWPWSQDVFIHSLLVHNRGCEIRTSVCHAVTCTAHNTTSLHAGLRMSRVHVSRISGAGREPCSWAMGVARVGRASILGH